MSTRPVETKLLPDPSSDAARRLLRLRRIAWVMDRSIPIGGGRRIGLDPIIGLIPGLGDWLGAAISSWLVYEALRLGLPGRVLGRMVLNIAIEAAVGAVPLLGDIFDAAWQANQRNLRLVESHYDGRLKPRPLRALGVGFLVVAGLLLALAAVLIALVVRSVWAVVGGGA